MADAREDADHLEVALHPHQVTGPQERLKIALHRDAQLPGTLPVTTLPFAHARLGPAEERILEQAGDVVGHRAVDRVLEIQHTWVRRADHQVAWHIVAMHQHFGLGQGAVDQVSADALPQGLLPGVEFDTQMPTNVPLRKQFQLAAQQRDVIAGQRRVHRQLLKSQQRVDGIGKQLIGVLLVNHVQIGFSAQVIEQKKAARQIFCINFWHINSRFRE